MAHLQINPRIEDGMWSDLMPELNLEQSDNARIIRCGNLPKGMLSGKPAFQIAVQLADGSVITAETSWALMRSALRAIEAAWPGED